MTRAMLRLLQNSIPTSFHYRSLGACLYCKRCGAKNAEKAAYCTSCGSAFAQERESTRKRGRSLLIVILIVAIAAVIGVVSFALLVPVHSNAASEIGSGSTEGRQGAEATQEAEQMAGGSSEGTSEPEAAFPDNPEPFWGIWIYASKDYDSARAFAADVSLAGGAPQVIQTAEWSNLNSEPWYAVSYSVEADELSAEAVCEDAKRAGYADAYVKYSGDYVGGVGFEVPDVAEGHLARIALPQPAMLLVEFDTSEQYVITATVGEVMLFKLFSPSSTSKKYSDEKKKRVYSLGYAGNGFEALDVQLELYYVNAAGTSNAHWNDATATKLAIEELLGLSVDELVAGIELRDMHPADVVDNPNPEVKWKLPEEFVLIGDDAS